jgi:predicted HicB family RNase H-like nuclease
MELTKITTRIPKALKRKLIAEAKRQNISLQELITNKLK